MDSLISTPVTNRAQQLQWAVAKRLFQGQTVSGDGYLVCPRPGGFLFAATDGLGHGEEAAAATTLALAALNTHCVEPVIRLLNIAHEALKKTRGAVITLASFDESSRCLTWLGVGNVDGVVLRRYGNAFRIYETVMLFPGIVGHQLPSMHTTVIQMETQDILIFATDGVEKGFLAESTFHHSPQYIAERICEKHSKGTDDALVLVVRFTNV